MSNLVTWAEKELAFMNDGDEMNERMYDHLIHMVGEFAKEGHSGFSASYAADMLDSLFRYKPINPLTGEESEWNSTCDDVLLQNNRCFHVFKNMKTGEIFDTEGKVFRSPNGGCYTNKDSCVPVTFPYRPKTEYVDVPDEEVEDTNG